MNVKELAKVLPDVLSISGDTDVEINSVAYDSRKVKDNGIFVAISGTNFDGHDFIPEAIKGGAKVIIGEKEMDIGNILYIRVKDARKALARTSAWFYGYPGDKLKIIGVTGTSGKTTITYLISEMLKEVGCRFGVIGTIGNVINGRKLPASLTTPESLELNRLFAEMLEHNTEYAVMEVSSHSLKLNRVTDLSFKVGIFTNLTQDHLDFHKDFDDYFLSKKKLFQQSEKAVINIDDKSGAKLLGMIDIPVLTYGVKGDADVKAKNIEITAEGAFYELVFNGGTYPVYFGTPGLFSVYNSLAAITTGIAMGFPLNSLIRAVGNVKGIPGRFELIKNNQDIYVIIDYAHKPDGLKNVLLTIKEFCSGKIITVFGCGGDRDRDKRPIMGQISSQLSDYTIITSDNPRSEDPEVIIKEIEKGIIGNDYEKISDRRKAIKRAISMANKGDVVLIAGKGHEDYQVLRDRTIHFDDKEIAKEYLRKIVEDL